MKGYLYTDLACEAWESDEKNKTSRKTPISDNISYSKAVISTQEEEKRYRQAKGTYTTFFTPQLGQLDHRSFELLCDSESRSELVARFMGVLELIKLRRILITTITVIEDVVEYNETGLEMSFVLNPDYDPSVATESEFDSDGGENNDSEKDEDDK